MFDVLIREMAVRFNLGDKALPSDWVLRFGRLSLLNFLNVAIGGLLKTNLAENPECGTQPDVTGGGWRESP